jgi:hypothetical protein
VFVDRGAAHKVAFRLERGPLCFLVEKGNDALNLGDGFHADPIAGQEEQAVCCHVVSHPVQRFD